MNPPEPLALDALLSADERLTVDRHAAFHEALSKPSRDYDKIDEECEIDPYVTGTNNRRTARELSRFLDLIDNLPISDSGKDGLL